MKKRFIPVMLASLMAFGAVGCKDKKEDDNNPGEQEPATYSVSIANKAALQGEWRLSDGNKSIEIEVSPKANVLELVNNGTIKISSSNEAVISIIGTKLSPNAVGKSTITVSCGSSVDSVEVEILDRQHGTYAEDPLTVAEAVQVAKALGSGATSTIVYYVKGVVKSNTWDAGYKNGTMWLKDGDNEFELYRYVMDDACKVDPASITAGKIVVAYGNIQNYQNKTFEMTQGCKVSEVIDNSIPCETLDVDAESMSIETGEVGRIAATRTPETTTDALSFEVENSEIATVTQNGRVKGVAAGETKVTVKCGEKSKEVVVTVTEAVAGPKTLEKIDHLIVDGVLPTSKPSAAQQKVIEQSVPGQTETIKAKFEGQWALPGSYENALQSNVATDYIHGDAEANLYVHKITLDVRKYVNIQVFASDDCTGTPIAAKNISGTAGADEHVVNEYMVNSKVWSIKANYDGSSYLHSVQLVVDSEPMALQLTGVEFPVESLSLTAGQEYAAPAKALEEGVSGVELAYESDDATTVAVDNEGNITALKESGFATITVTATKGDVTRTDTMEVSIAGSPLTVAEPEANTKYLFGLNQKGLGKFLYATGAVEGNYAASTELNAEGAKFELVAVEGGYNIKVTLSDDSVKYMNYVTSESGSNSYANIKFDDEAKIVWKLDLEKRCVYTPVTFATNTKNSGDYYVGAFKTNKTFSMSKTSFLTPGSTSYAAWFTILGARPAVTSVTLSKESLELEAGGSQVLTATVAPLNASEALIWASDDETVATVDATGKVVAVAAGTANITATAANEVKGTCAVTVKAAEVITAADCDFTFVDGDSGTLDATGWESSYASHEVTQYKGLKLTFTKHNKGGSNVAINTMPVSKGDALIVEALNGNTFKTISVGFKKWTGKKGVMHAYASADGEAWGDSLGNVDYSDVEDLAAFKLDISAIPAGTKFIKIAAAATGSQVGFAYFNCTFNTAE